MSRKAPEAEKPENHERWIVSYADMLTLLFALFVVLYAPSDANPQKLQSVRHSIDQAFSIGVLQGSNGSSPVFNNGGGLTPSISEIKSNTLAGLTETLNGFASANQIEGKIQVRSDADSITISLADNLLFDSGSADLKPGSQDVLMLVASALQGLPNQMRIEGHTDMTFTVPRTEFKKSIILTESVARELGAKDIISDDKITKVSLVGVGMKTHSGVAAKMFSTLSKEGINIMMISTSEIKISCVIEEKYTELAVRALHDAFELGEEK